MSFRTAFGTDGSGWQYRIARNDPEEGLEDLVTVRDDGYVGLGIMTPTFRLHLADDSAAKPGTSTWSTPSDARLKDPGSVEAFRDGRDVARSLRPVRYRYNGRAGLLPTEHIGVVAQEAEAAMPYAVQRFRARMDLDDREETELLAFKPHALQFVLVNAVREREARVQALEGRVADLSTQTPKVPPARP